VLAVVVAAIILMAAAALAWFTARARSRAIRTLNGTSARRIDHEDIVGFLVPVATGAVAVWAVAGIAVGTIWGWAFWGLYSAALAVLGGLVLAGAALAAFLVSLVARPSVDMIAHRIPAARALARPAKVVAFAAFALVVGVAAPAWSALGLSQDRAATQGAWNRFADQTVLRFTGDSLIGDSSAVDAAVGQLVRQAQANGAAALSEFEDQEWFASIRPLLKAPADQVLGGTEGLGLVNPVWLELAGFTVDGQAREGLRQIQVSELHPELIEGLRGRLAVLEQQSTDAPEAGDPVASDPMAGDPLDRVELWLYSGTEALPMVHAGGLAEMRFVSSAVLVVVDDLSLIDDSDLTSSASQSTLTFAGLDVTRTLIRSNGLTGQVYPERMAESGILLARYAEVFAWMMGAAFVAMLAASVVAAATSAFIVATRHARRDYGLALSGLSWGRITRGRALSELWLRVGFMALVCLWMATGSRISAGWSRPDGGGSVTTALVVTCSATVLAVAAGRVAHLWAARSVFGAVKTRRA
jgi:hypothetical protein